MKGKGHCCWENAVVVWLGTWGCFWGSETSLEVSWYARGFLTIMGKSKSSQGPMSRRCHGYLVTQLSYLLLLLVGKAVLYKRLNTGVLSDVVPHWLQRCGLRVTGWFRPSFFSTCGVGSLKPNVWKSVMWAWCLADLMKNISVGSLLIGPHSSLPRRKFSSWDPCLSHLWDLAKVGWAWGVISHWALSSLYLY